MTILIVVSAVVVLVVSMALLAVGAAAILAGTNPVRPVEVIFPWWYWPLAWLLFVGSIVTLAVVGDPL